MLKKALPTALALLSGLGIGIGVQQDQHPEYRQLHIEYWDDKAEVKKVKECGYRIINASGSPVKHGFWAAWTKNLSGECIKREEGRYENGEREGLWFYWGRLGEKTSENNYKNGKLDGLQILWYPFGNKQSEEHWSEGRLLMDPAPKYWDEKGNEIKAPK